MMTYGLYTCTLKAPPDLGYVLPEDEYACERGRIYLQVMQFQHQLQALFISQMEMILNRQFRIIGIDDCIVALFQICFPSAIPRRNLLIKLLVSSGATLSKRRCDNSTVWIGLDPPFTRKLLELKPVFLS